MFAKDYFTKIRVLATQWWPFYNHHNQSNEIDLDERVRNCFDQWTREERLHDRQLMSNKAAYRYFNYMDDVLKAQIKSMLESCSVEEIYDMFAKVSRDNVYVKMNLASILCQLGANLPNNNA